MQPYLHKAPFVLLDNQSRGSDRKAALFFSSPSDIITATKIDDVPLALSQIDAAVKSGRHVAGWISYECAYALEPKLGLCPSPLAPEPLIWMIVTEQPPTELSPTNLEKALHDANRGNQHVAVLDVQHNDIYDEYSKNLNKVADYIVAGDVYQVNHTFPLDIKLTGHPVSLYRRLRDAQPVEYGAFIDTGTNRILSFSPELFVRCDNGILKSKPMKGTIKRGRFPAEDEANRDRLKNDPKARAENLMIVDLIRNDLSKIAQKASVKTQSLFDIERYSTLWQMTSEIIAAPKSDLKPSHVIKALFPCGSVTGAPKVRAMQIIEEIEKNSRGVYCGTIGYFGPNGDFGLNVPIRTLALDTEYTLQQDTEPSLPCYVGRYSVGSGIVADSNKRDEYKECLLKGEFLERTNTSFSLIETLLLENGQYHLLNHHIERLKDSADFFEFYFDTEAILNELDHIETLHCHQSAFRVRLLLDKSGAISFTTAPLESSQRIWSLSDLPKMTTSPKTIGISANRVSSNDTYLFHKTTNRQLYDLTYQNTLAQGHVDSLFFNENDEITEGAISNIFFKVNNAWITPRRDAGVLNGVLRTHLIERGEVIEQKIVRDDLKHANDIAIGNSVRGLIRVGIMD